MSTGTLVILGLLLFGLLAFIGYFIMIYNGLISLKENIKKSWSNIDVILKQRYDELPKLISVCESYTEFEKGILDRLMKAREKYFKA
ncbi:MAG: LemA family protein, partial [Nitrospinaceae bacterium]|nr:LemA family protein [Nitrospinaceae bacterium]NIR57680.1 LemA family protein [Nitrospinaceae bacterium]NIT85022.1 LemA family protein [Nitrospinaceae bacterium]NIW08744.1 LemA family protein [Nitrospinaceae bacterium]NIX37335.1 LemA family protein [Nitrospinaceae bacterium]